MLSGQPCFFTGWHDACRSLVRLPRPEGNRGPASLQGIAPQKTSVQRSTDRDSCLDDGEQGIRSNRAQVLSVAPSLPIFSTASRAVTISMP